MADKPLSPFPFQKTTKKRPNDADPRSIKIPDPNFPIQMLDETKKGINESDRKDIS